MSLYVRCSKVPSHIGGMLSLVLTVHKVNPVMFWVQVCFYRRTLFRSTGLNIIFLNHYHQSNTSILKCPY